MNLIVAVDENWGIGKDNELLCRISADMKNFRAVTMGHVLVLGRKTLESFPGKKPLPKRTHVVLTANKAYEAEGVTLCQVWKNCLQCWRITRTMIFLFSAAAVFMSSFCLSAKRHTSPKSMINFLRILISPIWMKNRNGH